MNKRLLALFLAFVMLIGLLPVSAFAADGAGTGVSPLEGAASPVTPDGSGVYHITTGAELLWFAQEVNAGRLQSASVLLEADIDLGGAAWTPIGNSSGNYFAGSFDGGGHTVTGLSVDTDSAYAGLFGYVNGTSSAHASICNLTVEGAVRNRSSSYTNYTGGIAGYANYTEFLNCHNRAAVTGGTRYVGGVAGYLYNGGFARQCSNSGTIDAPDAEYVGGVIGNVSIFGSSVSVSSCVNSGAVSGKVKVGGVIGTISGAVSDLYNTGAVTGSEAVGGLLGYQGGDIENAYSTGEVTGTKDVGAAFGRVSSFYDRTNIYYLNTISISDANATGVDGEALAALADTLNGGREPAVWKSGPAGGYPLLSWQEASSGGEGGPLAPVADAVWRADSATGLLTGEACWSAVPHAESYTVVLWDYWARETASGSENGLSPIRTVTGVTGTSYDFTSDIEANGASWYYFTVTPVAAEGGGYESGTVPQTEDDAYAMIDFANDAACYRYTEQLSPATGLRWLEGFAYWEHVEDAFGYLILIYRLDDGGVPSYVAGGLADGASNMFDCRNYFAVGGRYVFSVIALSEEYYVTGDSTKNSPESPLSNDERNAGAENGVYTAESLPGTDPDEPDRSDWVPISSAAEWMELANVEDLPVDGDPQTNRQEEAWGKKYYLTADLDFSDLSAADEARTKSIGTNQHRFTGVLDGNGHRITGLTLSNYDSGLFAYIGSTGQVYDLTVEGANVLFSDNAAVLAHSNYGTIQNCAVVGCNITADTGAVLGGMVSRNYGVITESYVKGGTLQSNSSTATGHAGFVGSNETGGRIERCWTSMDVNTVSSYAGGFVGLGYGGTIRDCFALGDVSAAEYSGGFAGRSVYSGNRYENCYTAGTVTVSGEAGHGFIGGSKPDSAFQPDLSAELVNCYYNAASPADEYAAAKTLAEMQSTDFLIRLSGASPVWAQSAEKNGGLPYLIGVAVPEGLPSSPITVEVALAVYDRENYSFSQKDEAVSVTLESSGNTRVIDVMDAAMQAGLLTYSYETTPSFGRYIHTINGYAVEAPDGWMFTINDRLSNVSASLATVQDGDRLLWFEGTTENRFQGPSWDSLAGEQLEWVEIDSVKELRALAESADAEALGKNYRLTRDLDLEGADFPGIGTAEHPFTGVFDGQGHTVKNFSVSGAENVGFFGVIRGATVKNLHLSELSVTGEKRVGGLAGWSQAALDSEDLAENVAGLIGNCTVAGEVTGGSRVGGLVGENSGAYDEDTLFSIDCSVDRCSASVAVSGSGDSVGGLVGENGGVITESAATGDVAAPSATSVGGLVGDSTGDIYDSHAEGDVSGYGTVGGFAGYSSGIVKRCYSLGAVSGTENAGSFAGSISAAETTVGAGELTITGSSSAGYNGGFAGRLHGQITGTPNQITVKESYGNCMQPGGSTLPVVGNSVDFQGDAQKEVLREMTLSTPDAVSEKLYELFGVNLKGSESLAAEAEKYLDTLFVPNTTEVGATLSLLREGETAGEGITLAFATDSTYLSGGDTLSLAATNDTEGALRLSVTLAFSDGRTAYRKPVTVLLQAPAGTADSLMDAIAATLTESSDSWTAMDMAVYGTLPGKTYVTTPAARQNALNRIITSAAGDSASASDRARFEITLRALGIDSRQLYPVNSNTPFSNAAELSRMDLTAGGYYAAPWLLLADLQGNLQLSAAQRQELIALLREHVGDGLFGYEYGGVTYTDPDTAGAALAALARFQDSDPGAKEVVDAILAALPGALDASGSLGNANADAMVITGLLALGRDPAELRSEESGASLVDGLLSWANAEGDAFQYPNFLTGAREDNALATEQGFRALVALEKFDGGTPYNIYDFSQNTVVPGRATGSGEVTPPEEPDTDKTIQVTFTLKTDSELWIPTTTLTVKEGSTVYHAFTQAIRSAGDMSATGAESGYVTSITKNGVTLSEFDKGENSGWLYQVNGVTPNVGLTSYTLSDGDDILWFYTSDWTDEPGFGDGDDSDDDDDDTDDDKPEKLPFTDVEGHWAEDAIRYVYERGLMNGMEADLFLPDGEMTRAMLVTTLYRMEGSPKPGPDNPFTDVNSDAWYTDAVLWASENGIVNGVDEDLFAPDASITREQLATMLLRYAEYKSYDTSGRSDLSDFTDADQIGGWAKEALSWANAAGLIYGRSENTIAPQGTATRAEIATILMRFLESVAPGDAQ